MGYEIRDRQDGMFELVFAKPVLVGIFPERDGAERYCAFLADQDPDLPPDEPASFGQALRDVAEAEVEADVEIQEAAAEPAISPAAAVRKSRPRTQLPAVVPDQPRPPAQIHVPESAALTPELKQQAFNRIHNGEKTFDVAKDMGLNGMMLRAAWANYKRHMQKYLAEGGQETCAHCSRMFTPSVTNPFTCARCSK